MPSTNPTRAAPMAGGGARPGWPEQAPSNRDARPIEPSAPAESRAAGPSISLPKGGGAIRGIGEKFAANPVTGTGSMTVPIPTSPGRGGIGPNLLLTYNSGTGNGPFGYGWQLSIPSIARKTEKGLPLYCDGEESDVFLLSGAEDLVPVLRADAGGVWARDEAERDGYRILRYRPRTEGLFARIERWTRLSDGEIHWRSITKANVTTVYGRDANSRIADPADGRRIFSWLAAESSDDQGNALIYEYAPEDDAGVDPGLSRERNRTSLGRTANRYLKRIRYGNRAPCAAGEALSARDDWLFEVVFDYDEGHLTTREALDEWGEQEIVEAQIAPTRAWAVRQDPFSDFRATFEVRTYRLCHRVLMFHHFAEELATADCLVRCTEFTYAQSPIASFLTGVRQSGCVRLDDGAYLRKSLPPLEFEYTQASLAAEVREVDATSLENLPEGLDGFEHEWVDLDGEGIAGLLCRGAGGWLYKRNYSPVTDLFRPDLPTDGVCLGVAEPVDSIPAIAAPGGGGARFLDLAGDGRPDLVQWRGPLAGFHERTATYDWGDFTAFTSLLAIDWANPQLRFVDLTGDGHADLLLFEDEGLTWYPSLGEDGFDASARVAWPGDEEDGPRLVFADGTESIHLADLSGDGLTDLVRIRNGEVCYWPNLGYGRFGPKVTMDNAPCFDAPDLFDPARIRLADIDGSGTADIVYLHADGAVIYRNQSGNSWAEPERVEPALPMDNLASVQVLDLLGNGTACLVWSSLVPGETAARLRYVDLMGGQKPHLLVRVVNNLGAETRVQYVSSTRFYLEDKLAGTPWVTRLPFPVQVVERVETYDWISRNRFVTRYAYHHGYFDGAEREFRGFGRVDQWDTEEFAALGVSGDFPTGDNVEESSHVPPMLTKTWFHTGAWTEDAAISLQYASEYYAEPSASEAEQEATWLPDTVLPDGMGTDESREALRALRGAILRQEVYAVDNTDAAAHPYTVSERNYAIRLLQPLADNRHAVFFTHPREQVVFQYERNPADPRVAHTLTLDVDDFGNVLKSVAVGYGRRVPDPSLAPEDQARQSATMIALTENEFTNPVDQAEAYRAPLAAESRTFEVTGLAVEAGVRFDFDELADALDILAEIAYETAPDGSPQKRLIAKTRTHYQADDLSGPLPLRALESRALAYEAYRLAFTPGLVDEVYRGKGVEAGLAAEGGYVDLDGDAHWWVPSGRAYYSADAGASPDEELAEAEAHFFLPRRFEDPFGAATLVDYDDYDLLVERTTDAVGNSTSAVNDYRVLQPALVTDPNENRGAVAFDALGLVVGTAVMGKEPETLGDSLGGFEPDLEPGVAEAFFADPVADPQSLLGPATTRVLYDAFAYFRTQDADIPQPAAVATIARETHGSDLAAGQQTRVLTSLSYSDGFGREVQKKSQAEPGPVEAGGSEVNPRWVGSGWTILNNKGKPVRQFEPFFSSTHAFEFAHQTGVSPILLYDPPQRAVATFRPDHSWEKVVFDPWQQVSWDANDTVLIADPGQDEDVGPLVQRLDPSDYLTTWYAERLAGGFGEDQEAAAAKAAAHANTPATVYFDVLGRPFLALADNGVEGVYATRSQLDIRGLPLAITNARGNQVMTYTYDLLQRRVYSNSMDAGERWTFPNTAGGAARAWDARDQVFRTVYDDLQRPTHRFLTRGSSVEVLIERTLYGESHSDPLPLNLRAKPCVQYDGAGVATNEAFDFKGNLLRSSRRLALAYKTTIDWALLTDLANPEETATAAAPFLEAETFAQATAYDALNRPVSLVLPDSTQIENTYNEASLLEQVKARLRGAAEWTTLVEDLDYNAKGQRERLEYGNGVATEYEYDPLTFRLTLLRTTRDSEGDLQDLGYTYDPVGNITGIRDTAQPTIFFGGEEVTPDAEFAYDAIYRLIEATGREHIGQTTQADENDPPILSLPHPNDTQAMRRYTERYAYDEVGNILKLTHSADNGNWTRYYQYTATNNRLQATSLPGDDPLGPYTGQYTHDAHGSMTTMPHLPLMQWDWRDQLEATARQSVEDGGTPETTYYTYDASGQRVRKVTERQAVAGLTPTRKSERIYIGGFEVHREYEGDGTTVALERESLHVQDGQTRVALVETKTVDAADPTDLDTPLGRYQLGNHLGSSTIEIDAGGALISYEEYHPYGTTAYQAVNSSIGAAAKRYRYAGQERDEENRLCYHSARYYAPWLGRWTGADPITFAAPLIHCYSYAANDPTCQCDPTGLAPMDAIDMELERHVTSEFDRLAAKTGVFSASEVRVRVEVEPGRWVEGRVDRVLKDLSGELHFKEFKFDYYSPLTARQVEYIPAVRRGAPVVLLDDLPSLGISAGHTQRITTPYDIVTRWDLADQGKKLGGGIERPVSTVLRQRGDQVTRTDFWSNGKPTHRTYQAAARGARGFGPAVLPTVILGTATLLLSDDASAAEAFFPEATELYGSYEQDVASGDTAYTQTTSTATQLGLTALFWRGAVGLFGAPAAFLSLEGDNPESAALNEARAAEMEELVQQGRYERHEILWGISAYYLPIPAEDGIDPEFDANEISAR